jgi:hypothetical protein
VLAATNPRDKLARYATAARQVGERVGPMLAKLLAAACGGDPELTRFRTTINSERLIGAGAMVSHLASTGGLRTDLDPDRARDIVWTLILRELYELLVNDRGWSPHEYEQWLARALADAIADPADPCR